MFKFLILSFFLLFSSTLSALDFSGTYIGLRDNNKKLITGDGGTGPTSALTGIIKFVDNDKRVLINVEHNVDQSTVSIFLPTENLIFPDMPLDGDEFKGSDDRSGNHLLKFLDNEILAIFKKMLVLIIM